jgi:hypothetical protein
MKNLFAALTVLLTTTSIFACNLTQDQINTKASNGMWGETSGDYSFPPVITDWMTANGLWGTNNDS